MNQLKNTNSPVILIADDDRDILSIIETILQEDGYQTLTASDGEQAVMLVQTHAVQLLILDIMMPVLDGLEVCKQVRKMSDIPIIMLTAKDDDDDRILGLEIGADDYITKPFNNREVIARVKAVLRRSSAVKKDEAGGRSHIEYRGLSIDMEKYQVIAFGKKMTFTAKEMELLWCLASNPGKAFSRNQLLETIWGYSYYGDTRTVDTHIKRIRQKLNIPSDSDWDITTIWGVGYKFEVKDKK